MKDVRSWRDIPLIGLQLGVRVLPAHAVHPWRRRPLTMDDVRRARELAQQASKWPEHQFEAAAGKTSWETAQYCRQALGTFEAVARLIGISWAADHLMAHAGLRCLRPARGQDWLVNSVTHWAGRNWGLALDSFLVHAGWSRLGKLEPLRFAWANALKYASVKSCSAAFVRELGETYQQVSVSCHKQETRHFDKWRLCTTIADHAQHDRASDQNWWTPKRPQRMQRVTIELGELPGNTSKLADGVRLAHVVVERQQGGAGLLMDLELFSRQQPIGLFGRSPPLNLGFLQPMYPRLQGKVRPVMHPLFPWLHEISQPERAARVRKAERDAIRALYDAGEMREDLSSLLDRMGAKELAERWAHSKPSGIQYAQAISSKDRLDRLDQQLEALRDQWEHSVRLAGQYTDAFNRLTAETFVRWDDGEPPRNVRDQWGVRLLTRADRQLEPVHLAAMNTGETPQ